MCVLVWVLLFYCPLPFLLIHFFLNFFFKLAGEHATKRTQK